jgi:hypothetical protein
MAWAQQPQLRFAHALLQYDAAICRAAGLFSGAVDIA